MTYIVTDATVMHKIPYFEASPADCEITYSFSYSGFFTKSSLIESTRDFYLRVYGGDFNTVGSQTATIAGVSGATVATLDIELEVVNPCDKE